MKACNRPVILDALRARYSIENDYYVTELTQLKYGERYDMYDFHLYRVEGRYYDNVYIIRLEEGDKTIDFAELRFNRRGEHSDNPEYVWISVCNPALYRGDAQYLDYIACNLGLAFVNFTALDLCLDLHFNIGKTIKRNIKKPEITTLLNGKVVKDRNADRPEISYITSGSLNNHDKYLSVCVKQRRALKDKSRGATMIAYDKLAEIRNSSEKEYISEFYGHPEKLYRLEIHLNSEEIKDYFEEYPYENNYMAVIGGGQPLEDMLLYHLNLEFLT